VDVNELIGGIENLASVDARMHETRLCLQLGESLPPVEADGIQVQQVLLNLIRNAIDAMRDTDPASREILVRSRMWNDDAIEVTVSDNGSGLPDVPDDLLFQPFFTTKEGGVGMGLSISQSIIQSHGGRLWHSSKPEGGTTFHFTLPILTEGPDE
jgi:signal transduction histidine kinase